MMPDMTPLEKNTALMEEIMAKVENLPDAGDLQQYLTDGYVDSVTAAKPSEAEEAVAILLGDMEVEK